MNSDTKTKLRGVTFDLDFYTHPIAAILMQKMDEWAKQNDEKGLSTLM